MEHVIAQKIVRMIVMCQATPAVLKTVKVDAMQAGAVYAPPDVGMDVMHTVADVVMKTANTAVK